MSHHDQTEQADLQMISDAPDQLVYVREVRDGELPDSITPPPTGARIFAIHDSNGARLALTDDRTLAFRLAREHDRTPLSVH
jgi:hypothetical protein